MKLLKKKIAIIFGLLAILMIGTATESFAQKAMPKEIKFARGKTSKTVYGKLKNEQIAEYMFGVREGQKVRVKIRSYSPKGKFHAFSILGMDGIDYASDYDVNYDYTFTAPETGSYQIDVFFRPTEKVRSGKYALTLTITDE